MTFPLDVETPRSPTALARPRDAHERAWAHQRHEAVDLLGVRVHAVSTADALDQIERWIVARDRPRLVMTPDTTALMHAQSVPTLLDAYRRADLVTADGTGLVWASRRLGQPLPERVTGIDLLGDLCRRSADRRYRVFLLGSRPGVASAAADVLRRRHPELSIVGTRHGHFDRVQSEHVIKEINACAPDLLFVGMGVPRQEIWMADHAQTLNTPVVMGVGGSFDVLAGRVRRAPRRWQTLGLEWLWRAMWEPRRLWRARVIPRFMLQILTRKATSLSR